MFNFDSLILAQKEVIILVNSTILYTLKLLKDYILSVLIPPKIDNYVMW